MRRPQISDEIMECRGRERREREREENYGNDDGNLNNLPPSVILFKLLLLGAVPIVFGGEFYARFAPQKDLLRERRAH